MPDIPAGAITTWRLKPAVKKPSKPRVRTWQPKTRTGCLTCKKRRVKCDETKPECQRCIRGNFHCDGYAAPKPWLFESGSEEGADGSGSSSSGDSESPPKQEVLTVPSLWSDDVGADELRALQYFKGRTVPELATFTHSASHFWESIIPQLYVNNTTIRNAVVAVSSLHEFTRGRSIGPIRSSSNALYLRSYSKAVQDLTKRDNPPSQDIILMSCLIFLACANLLGSAPGVLIHLKAGLQVLRAQRDLNPPSTVSTADSTSDILLNYLEPIFARLEAQASLIPTIPRSANFAAYDLNWRPPTLPSNFADFNIARNCMHDVIQYTWYQGKRSNGPIIPSNPAYHFFLSQMQQWDEVFIISFPRHADPSWYFHLTASAIRLHVQALTLAFRHEASSDPMWIDSQHGQITQMVTNAEAIIHAGLPNSATTTYGFDDIWHHDFCIQPPLMLLGLHVREPTLRRKVLHLKRLHHCWYSSNEPYLACGSARMIEMVIDIEERDPQSQPQTRYSTTMPMTTDSTTPTTSPPAASVPSPPSSTHSHATTSPPSTTHNPSFTFPPLQSRIRPVTIILSLPQKLALSYLRYPFHSPEDTYFESVPFPFWRPPPINRVTLFPFTEMIVHGNFQGMIRPQRGHCLCGSLGGPQERMWLVEAT